MIGQGHRSLVLDSATPAAISSALFSCRLAYSVCWSSKSSSTTALQVAKNPHAGCHVPVGHGDDFSTDSMKLQVDARIGHGQIANPQ